LGRFSHFEKGGRKDEKIRAYYFDLFLLGCMGSPCWGKSKIEGRLSALYYPQSASEMDAGMGKEEPRC
jgi:hypothetical protein